MMALVDENEQVEQWRFSVLLEAGYPPELADKIARDLDADLHLAVALVERGCSPAKAAEIVL